MSDISDDLLTVRTPSEEAPPMDGHAAAAASPEPAPPHSQQSAPMARTVRRLSDAVVNRIAAGEVVERPASVVKELVENALDSSAGRIEITTAAGGKTLIRVSDDGHGMGASDLALSVERHCTSKLDHEAFSEIRTLGFRGEALASIGAVSRLEIRTRSQRADTGIAIGVDAGRIGEIAPVAHPAGTMVEVRDLFHATPARLKFLRADRTEAAAIADVVRRLALAHPAVTFRLVQGERGETLYRSAPRGDLAARIADVMGADFDAEALDLAVEREGVRLFGRIGLPSQSRPQASHQFLFVNGRPVRDRTLQGAIRAGYQDVLPRDRHPVVVIHLVIDPALVDVNVHPAKTEVRFRDAGLVRGLLVSAIRARLATEVRPAGVGETAARLAAFRAAGTLPSAAYQATGRARGGWPTRGIAAARARWGDAPPDPGTDPGPTATGADLPPTGWSEGMQAAFSGLGAPAARSFESGDGRASEDGSATAEAAGPAAQDTDDGGAASHPLGAAVAQIHGNYILAQTATGLVVVDQHAAHERIVYERLKTARGREGVAAQPLLIPEIVEMAPAEVDTLADQADELARFGLVLEPFGPGAIAVREIPAMLVRLDVPALVRDLASDAGTLSHGDRLEARIDHVAATIACHGSVRSGRRLSPAEMNALLRQIEATPNAGRCNHGRPTFVELDLADLERLFRRR